MNNPAEELQVFDNEISNHVLNSGITSKVLSELQTRGFNYLFKIKEKCISCKDYNIGFEEFDIVEVHSLETTSPAEHHVVYAITCNKYNIQGIVINPFENYANAFLNTCISKILNNEKLRFKYYTNTEG